MTQGLAHTHWPKGYDHDPVRHSHFGASETHDHEFYSDADYTEGRRYQAGKAMEFQSLYGGSAGAVFPEKLRRVYNTAPEDVPCCLDESCAYCQGWRRYWEQVKAKAARPAHVRWPFGRRHHLRVRQPINQKIDDFRSLGYREEREEGGSVQISDERLHEIRRYGQQQGCRAAEIAATALTQGLPKYLVGPAGGSEGPVLDAAQRRGFLDGIRRLLRTRVDDSWWERRHRCRLSDAEGVQRGLADRKAGRMRPWSKVNEELAREEGRCSQCGVSGGRHHFQCDRGFSRK